MVKFLLSGPILLCRGRGVAVLGVCLSLRLGGFFLSGLSVRVPVSRSSWSIFHTVVLWFLVHPVGCFVPTSGLFLVILSVVCLRSVFGLGCLQWALHCFSESLWFCCLCLGWSLTVSSFLFGASCFPLWFSCWFVWVRRSGLGSVWIWDYRIIWLVLQFFFQFCVLVGQGVVPFLLFI